MADLIRPSKRKNSISTFLPRMEPFSDKSFREQYGLFTILSNLNLTLRYKMIYDSNVALNT